MRDPTFVIFAVLCVTLSAWVAWDWWREFSAPKPLLKREERIARHLNMIAGSWL